MSRLSRIAWLLLATAALLFAQPNLQAQEFVQWSFDLNQATQVAASENKLVLLHFTATWCAPCKELDRFVFVNPTTIRALSTHVIPVKIDVDAHKFIADKYQITSVPTDVIMTPGGHVVSRQPSPRSSDGYLQLLSHAKAASENISVDSLNEQSKIRQAISVNQPIETGQRSQQNSSGFQMGSGGNFSPSGVQTPGMPSTAGGASITNKFFPHNDNSQFTQTPNQSMTTPHGSVYTGGQGANSSMQSQNVRNEYSNGYGPNSGGDFAVSPADRPGGMMRVQNPYITEADDSSLEMNSIAEVPDPSTNSGIDQSKTHAVSLPPIGLDGYCGVTLTEEQKWVKGDERYGCIHRGKLYFFASQESLDRFQMTPDMFSPLLGGADPVTFHESGKLVAGKRKLGIFYGEPGEPSLIVLFDSEANRMSFESDPPKYVQSVRQAMAQVDGNTLIR